MQSYPMSLNEFARLTGKTEDQAESYLSRKSFDVLELAYISKILRFDFFAVLDVSRAGVYPLRYRTRFALIEMDRDDAINLLEQHVH